MGVSQVAVNPAPGRTVDRPIAVRAALFPRGVARFAHGSFTPVETGLVRLQISPP